MTYSRSPVAAVAPTLMRALHPYSFDLIGDSRTANLFVNGIINRGKCAYSWFNQANALLGQRMRLGLNLGISGYRPDQYIAANLGQALASTAAWLVFGFPCVNALAAVPTSGVFPYTDVNGQTVAATTVAQCAANDIIGAANKALAAGKKVILTMEPGASNLTAAQVTQLHEFNLRLKAYADATPGVFLWSANGVLWNPTGSTSQITFRSNVLLDGATHFNALGGFLAGQQFARFIGPLLGGAPYAPGLGKVGDGGFDFAMASASDNPTNNARQLVTNGLFTSLTGGATAGSGTLSSGTVPASWTLKQPLSTTSCTITSAANADGFGNDVTFALTATAADTVSIYNATPATNTWTIADVMQAGIDIDVAAGSTNAVVYIDLLIGGTKAAADASLHAYDLYSQAGPGIPVAYSQRLLSEAVSLASTGADTKTYTQLAVYVVFSGSGSIALTVRRAAYNRRFSYSPQGGFAG